MTDSIAHTILQQIGGTRLNGAVVYCGGSQLVANNKLVASSMDEQGFVTFCGLMFKVNGKRGQTWKMIIAYERGSDTYTVRLVYIYGAARIRKTGKVAELLGECKDVHAEELQGVVESLYDEAIKEHCDGFIPL